MPKIYQSSQSNDKNAFRKYKYKIFLFQILAVRTGKCAYMDATLLRVRQPHSQSL